MKENNFKAQFLASISECKCYVGKENAEEFIQNLYDVLFQVGKKQITTEKDFNAYFNELESSFTDVLLDVLTDKEELISIKEKLFDAIPSIYAILIEDAEFILQNDPAAKSIREIQIAYPGFFATAVYRFSHLLYQLNIPILPRILSEYAHSKTGIDIHPGASIGKQFMIDHGTGVVIGETTIIGNQVKIFQGVTLGAISVSREIKDTKRHPTIKDNVVIYSGATILGGSTVIGENSVIGGNVWLTHSIEPHSRIFHKSQIIVKGEKIKKEPINFVI
ncbi:serine O-acetyltransferase EpsC [Tenacibaculum sp. IB213877]|uniref:serine O-acetyltransferase EpsC n=1 Tax=Tenacibaculum sp. IB213877 TaxID=3097351 RepID=UPI002A59CC0C|nr:serine O-acetyltransferase EpsC [Tenacibaculum sp. IB213877]MDY0780177.1 serine O-acetyltransferase EpsC [Tenacibaculum sp. IB213877]